jgi:hypothetical protein
MNERIRISITLIGSHIVMVPALLLIFFYIDKYAFLSLSITQTVLCGLYIAGYWEFFGLRFRKVFCLCLEFVLILLFVFRLLFGSEQGGNLYLLVLLSIIQAYLLLELIKIAIVIFRKDLQTVEIEFPFKHGSYLVTDGGNSRISRLMNYHYYSPTHRKNKTSKSMLFATDIIKIEAGTWKFLPICNEDYPVFGEKIYSPLDGVVVKVMNGIPDNKPFSGNYPYNTGNTVVIRRDNYYVLLGHLKKDSIILKEGDVVKKNNLIGAAGNSGWTERPHLHMQVIQSDSLNYWSGKGISIRFNKCNLYKNRRIVLT